MMCWNSDSWPLLQWRERPEESDNSNSDSVKKGLREVHPGVLMDKMSAGNVFPQEDTFALDLFSYSMFIFMFEELKLYVF